MNQMTSTPDPDKQEISMMLAIISELRASLETTRSDEFSTSISEALSDGRINPTELNRLKQIAMKIKTDKNDKLTLRDVVIAELAVMKDHFKDSPEGMAALSQAISDGKITREEITNLRTLHRMILIPKPKIDIQKK